MSNPTARPLVHFSDKEAGRDRSLARQYAREAVSKKVLDGRDNLILTQAGAGHSVDAYDLNRAVTAAIRSASTRKGQSMARRSQATHFAHLGHIVQAVLENHADSLPAYEPGERSRAVEYARTTLAEAKVEVDNLTSTVLTLRAERSDLTQAASDERRRLCAEIDALKAEADDNHAQAVAEGQSLYREINERAAALSYAFGMLTSEQQSRLAGFQDGWQAADTED